MPAKQQIPKSRVSNFRLQISRSAIAGQGVFAVEEIPRGRRVLEYTGEALNRKQVQERLARTFGPRGSRHLSMFLLNNRRWVDGSVGGSGAEKVNHSCEPNLSVRKIRGHILFFSRKRIRRGEELTIDYRVPWEAVRMPCRCGAKKCRGTLNSKD